MRASTLNKFIASGSCTRAFWRCGLPRSFTRSATPSLFREGCKEIATHHNNKRIIPSPHYRASASSIGCTQCSEEAALAGTAFVGLGHLFSLHQGGLKLLSPPALVSCRPRRRFAFSRKRRGAEGWGAEVDATAKRMRLTFCSLVLKMVVEVGPMVGRGRWLVCRDPALHGGDGLSRPLLR